MTSRRRFVAGLAAAALAAPARAAAAPASMGPTLAEAARKAGLLFGASIGPEAFADPAYADLYRREADVLVTDVALKFDWLRPTPERFEFGPADAVFDAARANGKQVRGHTLIWNDNQPDWLKRLSGAEIERVFDAHIETVASRYAGRLHSWDVVNEPFWPMHGKPGGWRDGPWFSAMGPAYVERAFRRVRAVDKTAKLTLNEAQCDNDHDWGRSIRPPLRDLVDRLLDAGAPLDAIGLQSHLQPQWPSNYPEFARCRRVRPQGPRRLSERVRRQRRGLPRRSGPPRRRGGEDRAGLSRRDPGRPRRRHGRHLAIVRPPHLVSAGPPKLGPAPARAAHAAFRRRLSPQADARGDDRRLCGASQPAISELVTMLVHFRHEGDPSSPACVRESE